MDNSNKSSEGQQNQQGSSQSQNHNANLLRRFEDPKGQKLKHKFLNFIMDIKNDKRDFLDLASTVKNFMESFEREVQETWNENEADENANGEAIEGLLTKNLYDKLMALYPLQQDSIVNKIFEIYNFIEPKHLEIPEGTIEESTLETAIKEIQRLQKYKTPRDKVIIIMNCSKILSLMIQHAAKNQSKITGADDFLPILIYTIFKAKPQNLASDIEFIKDFRSPDRLKGQAEYYFTSFESALQFIREISFDSLKIQEEEKEEIKNIHEQNIQSYEQRQIQNLTSGNEKRNINSSPPNEAEINQDQKIEYYEEKSQVQQNNDEVQVDYPSLFTELQKKLSLIKNTHNFEAKSKQFYNMDPKELKIGQIDELVGDYNKVCNQYKDMCRKLEDLSNFIEENHKQKKQEKSLLGFFKLA